MDNLWEIFPSTEYYYYLDDHPQLLHQIPSQQPNGILSSSQQNYTMEDPTSWINPNNNDCGESFKKKRKRREMKLQSGDDDDSCRRALHRDVEKRRRNQMANLYESLRSLLPLQYIKGKRSASDHMQASVSYIKDLEKKVEGLHKKREKMIMKMKKTSSSSSNIVVEKEAKSAKWCCANDICVAVNKCEDGIEILMNTRHRRGGVEYPLSELLETLLRQGLNVVNCCYSHQEDRSLLRIQAQVNGWSDVDEAALQQKVVDVVIKPH
ncbi:transcription factor bHLH118-like isoform X1 [Ipomoea triloba]|uniref:transcription factor bHLH118-like isoform X1 n=1 Tax=Ipomoea triloba TaxID=35885 RepID=UPI00125D4AC1|nr:transcription factor bHLH118-like isoform X1 [Ipomoea triloba]